MLTIEDLRNPARKSGFDYVAVTRGGQGTNPKDHGDRKGGFRAAKYGGSLTKAGHAWQGAMHSDAEKAAQEYCNAVNEGKITMSERTRRKKEELEAIRAGLPRQTCACGHFDVIASDYYSSATAPNTEGKWALCVECYRELERERQRSYRDGAATLNTAGHEGKREPLVRDADVEAALGILRDARGQRRGRQGYVYLIGVTNDDWAVKVGYSTNPQARVSEHQTSNGRILELLAYKPGTPADERDLHAKYVKDNTVCEWFHPSSELFTEFGLDYHEWMKSLQGAITAPEGKLVAA